MAATQCRALAGCRAMAFRPVKTCRPVKVENGSKWFMRRRDSFMVEVTVADDETEDVAVRKFMKSVVSSNLINQLRARRHKETKIETWKRKLAERAMARKLKLVDPTWEEIYGEDVERKPFDDWFSRDPLDEDELFWQAAEGSAEGVAPMGSMDEGMYTVPPTTFSNSGYNQGGFGGSYTTGYAQ